MNGVIEISIEEYTEMLKTCTEMKALERYVNTEEYSVDRNKIAAICGFELKEIEKDASV